MNPICPSEKTPVNPLVRLRLTVRMMNSPRLMTSPCQNAWPLASSSAKATDDRRMTRSGPDALRPDEEDEDEDDEHDGIAVARQRARQPLLQEATHLGRDGAGREQVADPGEGSDEDLEEAE